MALADYFERFEQIVEDGRALYKCLEDGCAHVVDSDECADLLEDLRDHRLTAHPYVGSMTIDFLPPMILRA